jgi:hypothetical protein
VLQNVCIVQYRFDLADLEIVATFDRAPRKAFD